MANEDSTISLDTRQQIHADRADIHKQIEIRQGNLSHAVALLQQEQDDKPHYIRLILFVTALLLLSSLSYYAKIRIRNYKRQVFEDIAIEERRMRDDIKEKEDKLLSQTKQEKQRQETLQKQQAMLMQENSKIAEETISLRQQQEALFDMRIKKLEGNCHTLSLSHNMLNDLHWKNSEELYETVNTLFCQLANKLKAIGSLNEKEIRLCILVLIGNMKDKEIADILCYSDKTIRGTKRKVAIKLGTTSAGLRNFLLNKAAE